MNTDALVFSLFFRICLLFLVDNEDVNMNVNVNVECE